MRDPRTLWSTSDRWQRNLYVMFLTELLSVMGFLMVVPFLTLYVGELGASFGSIEFWAGAAFSVLSLTRIVAGPVWGALADRLGRKLMVQRAMFGGVLVMGAMAFARSAEQLAFLRALQGLLTGTVFAANTLVAASAPPERNGYAMGLMQTSVWIGASLGPILGGVIADVVGFRPAFLISAGCLLVAGLGVTVFVREEFEPAGTEGLNRHEIWEDWKNILRLPGLREILGMRLLVKSRLGVLMAFLPLFVASLVVSQGRVSTITGVVTGVTAACGALSAAYLGQLGDRIGHRRLLLLGSLGVALSYALMFLVVSEAWQLILLSAVAGLALGGVAPAVKALMNETAPAEQMGAVYGVDASVNSVGRVVLPMVGSVVVGATSPRSVFGILAGMFAVVAVLVLVRRAPMRETRHNVVLEVERTLQKLQRG